MMLAIAETTRLECLNLSLSDVLQRFKTLNDGEHHIVADEKQNALARRTLSEAFMKARRESGLKWESTAPSFHEIRSLSARLYTEEKGKDYAQKLLGHKSATMTDKYRDVRGSEWMEV
ncbi:tyrosine-type recombinase/integrase [Sodalis sp. (in: enterobacteria)]|uniref:tyrosine-type recombinase/integrase n=1 Tax=Sodalis sp. (in: enterobacteria) TaxID=1898979 RepID=UPI003F3E0010